MLPESLANIRPYEGLHAAVAKGNRHLFKIVDQVLEYSYLDGCHWPVEHPAALQFFGESSQFGLERSAHTRS